jgi:hypothetical protein
LKTIFCQGLREIMMFGFDTVIVQERASAESCIEPKNPLPERVLADLSEVSSSLENIPVPPDQKKAILQLIDAKINNDMKEVIAKLNELEGKLEVKIQMTNDKLSNEIKIVYWMIGIVMAIIMFVVARK